MSTVDAIKKARKQKIFSWIIIFLLTLGFAIIPVLIKAGIDVNKILIFAIAIVEIVLIARISSVSFKKQSIAKDYLKNEIEGIILSRNRSYYEELTINYQEKYIILIKLKLESKKKVKYCKEEILKSLTPYLNRLKKLTNEKFEVRFI